MRFSYIITAFVACNVFAFYPAPSCLKGTFLNLSTKNVGNLFTRALDIKSIDSQAHWSLKLNQIEMGLSFSSKAKSIFSGSNRAAFSPTILVGPQSSDTELSRLAAALTSEKPINLSSIIESDGLKAASAALSKAKLGSVFIIDGISILNEGVKKMLKNQPLTIHVAVDPLKLDSSGALRKECESITKYTLVVIDDLEVAFQDLKMLLKHARQSHPSASDIRLNMGDNTFFLSLTFPDLRPHRDLLGDLVQGTDAMELRVDLLDSHEPYSVLTQLQVLRRYTSRLPVIYTIRSEGQCGAFKNDPKQIFELLKWGLRGGVEYLDIEANWDWKYRHTIIKEARSKYPSTILMGSYHVVGKKTTIPEIKKLFKRCYHRGLVDAIKVVSTAFETKDSYEIHEAANQLSLPVPYVGLCLTPTGSLSRVLNKSFTPVTSSKLPSIAAPGQLTADTIMRLRKELNILQPKRFYLFGSPISSSPSPNMHNAGFQHCNLPYTYELCESEGTDEMKAILATSDFGGASVTIPHKQNVLPFLDHISPAAKEIGAVNTVVVHFNPKSGKRELHGENTDWLGILRPIKKRLAEKNESKGNQVALIVGAGGAAMSALYAMKQLGMQLVVYNRTLEKAQKLAKLFGGSAVSELDGKTFRHACGQESPNVVISTVPGSAEFRLPPEMLKSRPIIFDAAYKPAVTALLKQAIESECTYVQGAEMLIEQGIEAFQFWTNRVAPKEVMAESVYTSMNAL